MSTKYLTVILSVTIACSGGQIEIIFDHTSLEGAMVAVLPYDRDEVLQRGAPIPRDSVLASLVLDSLARELVRFETASAHWQDAFEALDRRRIALEALPRSGDAYRTEYASYLRAEEHVQALDRTRELAFSAVEAHRTSIDARMATLEGRWDDWWAIAETEIRDLAESSVEERLEVASRSMALSTPRAPGRWWVHLRTEDPLNPYGELYWNLPVIVSRSGTSRVALSDGNVEKRLRGAP